MPKVFLSYAWESAEHRAWVAELSNRLRTDGIEVTLDQWYLALGESRTEFMEAAVRNSDFVLIICTPKYRDLADRRIGGVGYEQDLMTAEAVTKRNRRKFIPVLRAGTWEDSLPTWLAPSYGLDLRGPSYPEAAYRSLLDALFGMPSALVPIAPRRGTIPERLENLFRTLRRLLHLGLLS